MNRKGDARKGCKMVKFLGKDKGVQLWKIVFDVAGGRNIFMEGKRESLACHEGGSRLHRYDSSNCLNDCLPERTESKCWKCQHFKGGRGKGTTEAHSVQSNTGGGDYRFS